MSIKIVIVDDHQIMREGLCSMLAQEPGFAVVGDASNGRDALELVEKTHPDVVIMDINMPDMNGTEATRRIVEKFPTIRVVALSMYSEKTFVTAMLKAGASGYLLKDCSKNEIVDAIKTVADNKSYLCPDITGIIIEDYVLHSASDTPSAVTQLTNKEREVLQLIAEGHTSKEIALHLNIATKTVESHRLNIMSKLEIHSIAELTKFAIRHGITCLDI
ncbi:response regulator transcription factor [bacterium]|nr:response regulator transcription factor [bacterium]